MKPTLSHPPGRLLRHQDLPGVLLWLGIALLALFPAPLMPAARLFHALCVPFPALALLGRLVPPLPLGLLLLVIVIVGGTASTSATRTLLGARRLSRTLAQLAAPAPPRLLDVARPLGLELHLTYLPLPAPAAFCHGLLSPRVAVTAGLVSRLSDTELTAVLLHERHHQRRRDPLRYFILHAAAAGLFMLPLAPAARLWFETRIELAADQAALAVVPRQALAGALMATLSGSSPASFALASLSATEARIAHLAGRSELSTPPRSAILVTIVLICVMVAVLASLAHPHDLWQVICTLCPALE